MRETFIAILVLASLTVAIVLLRERHAISPQVLGAREQKTVQKDSPNTRVANEKKTKAIQGGKHERIYRERYRKNEPGGTQAVVARPADESAVEGSGKTGETEGLPSIYPDEGFHAVSEVIRETVEPPTPQKVSKKSIVLHGVPVQAWVLSQRDSIARAVTPDEGDSLRLFLWCMELKKNRLETVEPKQCGALTRKDSPELGLTGVRRSQTY